MKVYKRLISRNFSAGRRGKKVKRIIMHTYGAKGTSLYNWFNNPNAKSSAHYAVWKSGRVEQYVKESDAAWHATNWNINLESIGIEHQDDGVPSDAKRTRQLYESSARLVAWICKRYNIKCNSNFIEPHRKYYPKKSCPGALDLNRIIKRANQILKPEPKPKPKPKPKSIYKVYKKRKLLGKFRNKDKAFDRWYTRKGDKVVYKGKNITSAFKKTMNILKKKLTKRIKQIKQMQSKIRKLDKQRQDYKHELSTARKQIKIIKNKNIELEKKVSSLEKKLQDGGNNDPFDGGDNSGGWFRDLIGGLFGK